MNSKLQTQKEQIQSRLEYLLSKIDVLVYDLYELTEDEIAIIDGNLPTI